MVDPVDENGLCGSEGEGWGVSMGTNKSKKGEGDVPLSVWEGWVYGEV